MIVCSSCGQVNPPEARFCNSCGSPLTGETVSTREVRKTVTVVFCDVIGSTELGERFDPEVLRGMMARFYAAVREPVERHGGRVEKVIGDALVAVFGIPVVHEDDALRAVRAALEMRDAVRSMGDLQARIGVNTGDVLARDATEHESLVVGDAVNVAARLEQAAGPGEVLVGAPTWELVEHAVRGERVAPVVAKGKREPLVAWRLESVDPAAGGHRRRLDLPIVGRESELDLLRWALQRTQQVARPHLLMVLGQAGIGKSRLVSEMSRLGEGVTVLTGHCRPLSGSSSLEPLLEVAREALPSGHESVADVMAGDPEAAAVAAVLTPGIAAGAADVTWAVARLLGSMASDRTVVVVLEDVHWADDLLLDVVEQLLARGRRGSLLVACTARPEFAERRPTWGAGTNAISLGLERLDDGQTLRLLTHASPGLAPAQTASIIAAAEGNPLFAEHLAALVGDNGKDAGRLPRSIQVVLTARLEALPEAELEVASVAAVAGRRFPVAAVEALVGRSIDAELDHLAQRELVEAAEPGWRQFGHALLRDAAYELIPKRRRGELHVRLARWLDEDGAGDADVGTHLERAVALRLELDQNDDETRAIAEEAGLRLAAAGRRADAVGDPRRARMLLERALELLPADHPGRAVAIVELAAAGWNLFPPEELAQLLATGAELAATLGLRSVELRARMLRLGVVSESLDDSATEPRLLQETEAALRELESLDDPRAVASVLCTRAEVEMMLGRAASAATSVRRALDLLRRADEDTVWALAILVFAATESPMPVPEAEALLGDLLDEFGSRPTVRSELTQGRALLALLSGEADRAWALFESSEEIERDLGRTSSWRVRTNRGRMLIIGGRFEEARTLFAPMVAEAGTYGAFSEREVVRSRLSLVDARLGNLELARTSAEAVLDSTAHGVAYEARTRAGQVLSEVAMAEGRVQDALRFARDAEAVASLGDWVLMDAGAKMTLARALAASGELQAAADMAEAAARLFADKRHPAGSDEARTLLSSLPVPGG